MRTVTYADIRAQVLSLANTDASTATAADLVKIGVFINRRGKQAFQFAFWNETLLAEERDVQTSGERVFVDLAQTGTPTPTVIGQVKGCYLDDPLVDAQPRPVRYVLSGDAIYLPDYGYESVFVWFQIAPPADFTTSSAIPAILRDAIAHAAYSDWLRPSAKTSEAPFEETAGAAFLMDEYRKLVAMQGQSGRWRQN